MPNYTTFAKNIEDALEGKTVGYSYTIYHGDELKKHKGKGWAVRPAPISPAGIKQLSTRRMSTMSMTKTITAAAVVKVLAQMPNVSRNSLIHPFLPSNWKLGPNVKKITFKHLLLHTSGLRVQTSPKSDPDDYSNLRETIKIGSTNSNFGANLYQNCNFCLFRILIPYLLNGAAFFKHSEDVESGGFIGTDVLTASTYVGYVQGQILEFAGIKDANVWPMGAIPFTRYYNFNDNSKSYADDGPRIYPLLHCGAGYWNLSAQEYGKFVLALRSGAIFRTTPSSEKNVALWNLMSNELLGCYPAVGNASYRGHNGKFSNGQGAGCQGAWMAYPDGVTAVVLINSFGGLSKDPFLILQEAYDAA